MQSDKANESVVRGRRPLALLALLAGGGSNGVSRERVLAYLWPERDEAHARNTLNQLLFALRRDTGQVEAVLGRTELRLNCEIISSDLDEFARAITRSELELAAALYGGPFLDGFFLSGAAEFEHWVADFRHRLSDQHFTVLEHLAEESGRNNDAAGALRWSRELVHSDPASARATIAYMEALAGMGDIGGALRHARVHGTLLREEFELPLDPAVRSLVQRLWKSCDEQSVPTEIGAGDPPLAISAARARDAIVQPSADRSDIESKLRECTSRNSPPSV